jgi:hypothetical protein
MMDGNTELLSFSDEIFHHPSCLINRRILDFVVLHNTLHSTAAVPWSFFIAFSCPSGPSSLLTYCSDWLTKPNQQNK